MCGACRRAFLDLENYTMAEIFEKKVRTRTEPKKQGEGDFQFYDSSARPEYDTYRGLLNGWMNEVPEADRAEIVTRFRTGTDLQYKAVFAELTTHAALKRQDYVMDLHPKCGHATRKPDFLAKKTDQSPVAIVEVTTFTPATPEVSQSKRDADVYNALDKAKLPAGWRLGLDIVNHGDKPAGLNKFRSDVEKWAAEVAGDDFKIMPTKTFDYEGWSIELTLYGGFDKDVPAEHAIASAMGNIRKIDPALEIRQAVEEKGSRYGAMTNPYLIVVADCKDELSGGSRNGEALVEAMFGTRVTRVTKDAKGKTLTEDVRRQDGYWGTPDAPKHRNVSGILVLPRPHLWDLRDERWQPLLVRNPWAERPLPDDFLPLPGFKHVKDAQYAPTEGKALADILVLPTRWPP
jgi:hypothetical protein